MMGEKFNILIQVADKKEQRSKNFRKLNLLI